MCTLFSYFKVKTHTIQNTFCRKLSNAAKRNVYNQPNYMIQADKQYN